MTRTSLTYQVNLTEELKKKLLLWAQEFDHVIWLDSNDYAQSDIQYKAILAADSLDQIMVNTPSAFDRLEAFQRSTTDWLFGYLSYDLKNEVEDLNSTNFDGLNFPELFFFQPKRLFLFTENHVEICYHPSVVDQVESDWNVVKTMEFKKEEKSEGRVKMRLRTSKDRYFEKMDQLLHHIHRGDIYEANFCQEFYATDVELDPITTYWDLNRISLPPFACFLKVEGYFALSASPERFLARRGSRVISQPIKGTAPRGESALEDVRLAESLKSDPKERSENIMIVDLVRNDLSKIALKGTVEVLELCGLYSFKQVHQLISTVGCTVAPEKSSIEIIKHTFPMGSMTGAPKVSAMKIIEQLEETKRGVYSGAIGYFDPEGNFDFNVVIRSILYNQHQKYLSVCVGGAITAASIPEKEYEECLIKAKAMREALGGSV